MLQNSNSAVSAPRGQEKFLSERMPRAFKKDECNHKRYLSTYATSRGSKEEMQSFEYDEYERMKRHTLSSTTTKMWPFQTVRAAASDPVASHQIKNHSERFSHVLKLSHERIKKPFLKRKAL